MICGLESPEQIAECIYIAKRWSQVIFDLIGLGSFALIAILLWLFKRLRKDLTKWEDDLVHERELRTAAANAERQAEHRAQIAEKLAEQTVTDKVELERILKSDVDEQRRILTTAQIELSASRKQVDDALSATAGGTTDFWSRPVGNRFDSYETLLDSSIPILMFGNQKGGVGKSTLVSNLAGAFAERGERILCVDLDYQGSLSSLAQLQMGASDKDPESLIDWLFLDELDPNWPKLAIREIASRIHYIPAYYDFELIERRIEYRWALGTTSDDVRYRLARALLSPSVQDNYDRVLIDAPPRFTLGFINGYCTSTHLYVPTVVDSLSTGAVAAFARQFSELKHANPRILWAGIIGTMTFRNPKDPMQLPANAEKFAEAAERAAQRQFRTGESLFIRNPVIIRDADLAQATDKGIAYLNDSTVRPMFDALASAIERKAPRKIKP